MAVDQAVVVIIVLRAMGLGRLRDVTGLSGLAGTKIAISHGCHTASACAVGGEARGCLATHDDTPS